MRNIGSSIGISIVMTYLAQRMQINHAFFSEFITPFNQSLQQAANAGLVNTDSAKGLSQLNAMVNQEAATLAYLQDFRLMMWITLAATPLILLFSSKKPSLQPA